MPTRRYSRLGCLLPARATARVAASTPRPAQCIGERPVVRDQARHPPGGVPDLPLQGRDLRGGPPWQAPIRRRAAWLMRQRRWPPAPATRSSEAGIGMPQATATRVDNNGHECVSLVATDHHETDNRRLRHPPERPPRFPAPAVQGPPCALCSGHAPAAPAGVSCHATYRRLPDPHQNEIRRAPRVTAG